MKKLKHSGLLFSILGILLVGFCGVAYVTYAHWAVPSADYYINPANMDLPEQAAIDAIQYGASTWNNQTSASFRFRYAGVTNQTSTGYDSKNMVVFRNESNGSAIASTYSWWNSNNELLDSDIIIWDAPFTFFTGSSGCMEAGISNSAYLEDIMAHEFGHAMGMQHSSVGTATMYPSYSYCSQEFRTLDPDDIAGIEALYPASSPAPSPSPSPSPSPVPTSLNISSVQVSNISGTSATVKWVTDLASDSKVEYETDAVFLVTGSYSMSSPLNSSLVTSHALNLSGLSSGTKYHYRVISNGSGLSASSADRSFSTSTPRVKRRR